MEKNIIDSEEGDFEGGMVLQGSRAEGHRQILEVLQRRKPSVLPEDLAVIQAQYANDLGTSFAAYSENWLYLPEMMKDVFDWMAERLEGQTLVDLGGGAYGTGWKLAKMFKVGTYVSVDLCAFDGSRAPNPSLPIIEKGRESQPEESPRRIHVKDDILNFLLHLRDGSANFMLNGIDTVVLPTAFCIKDRSVGPRYHGRIADELHRALQPGGLILGLASDPLDVLAERVRRSEVAGLSKKEFANLPIDWHVFEKKTV